MNDVHLEDNCDGRKTSHTLGPWKVTHDSDDILRVVPESSEYPICDLGSVDADDYDADVIAILRADAALIAAAPDMLAALKELLPEGWGDDDTMDHMPGVKAARLAIAKATAS